MQVGIWTPVLLVVSPEWKTTFLHYVLVFLYNHPEPGAGLTFPTGTCCKSGNKRDREHAFGRAPGPASESAGDRKAAWQTLLWISSLRRHQHSCNPLFVELLAMYLLPAAKKNGGKLHVTWEHTANIAWLIVHYVHHPLTRLCQPCVVHSGTCWVAIFLLSADTHSGFTAFTALLWSPRLSVTDSCLCFHFSSTAPKQEQHWARPTEPAPLSCHCQGMKTPFPSEIQTRTFQCQCASSVCTQHRSKCFSWWRILTLK